MSAPLGSDAFKAALPGADFLVGLGKTAIDAAFYAGAPNLKLLQVPSPVAARHGSPARQESSRA